MTEKNGTLPRLDILEGLGKHLFSGKLNHKKFFLGYLSEDRTVPNEKFGDAICRHILDFVKRYKITYKLSPTLIPNS